MNFEEEDEKQLMLKAVGYDKMTVGSSKDAYRTEVGEWKVCRDGSGDWMSGPHAGAFVKITKDILGPQFTYGLEAGLERQKNGPEAKLKRKQNNVDWFGARAQVDDGKFYKGAHADVHAFDINLGPVHGQVGAGVDFGAGIKDDSLELDLGVVDVKIGRKIGFGIMGNEFDIDLGKIFGNAVSSEPEDTKEKKKNKIKN